MDELMMDWLYDELDPASSARVAEHVGACPRCSVEIGALRRTREAFRDLPLLEPPTSVSAILLHQAARRRAPAAAATAVASTAASAAPAPRFVDRLRAWLRPIVVHPALTAAATLLVVAGVAGTLYVRGRADMARPRVRATASSAPSRTEPPLGNRRDSGTAASSGANLLDGARQAELEKAQSADDKVGTDDQAGAMKQKRTAEVIGAEAGQKPEAAEQKQPNRKALDRAGPPARMNPTGLGPARENQAGTAATAGVPAQGNAVGGAATAGVPAQGDAVGAAGTAAPAPANAPEVAPAAEVLLDEPSDGRHQLRREQSPSRTELGWLEAQETRLGELARKRRCREAATIANDILDRNPDYYARRVMKSKQVEPCSWYVGDERRRRAARRVQEGPSKAAAKTGGAGAPQKAPAAPEKDEAAAGQSGR